MVAKQRKIGLIFASGTALSSVKRKTVVFVDREEDIGQWLLEIPEISVMAQIEPIFFHPESEYFLEEKSVDLARFILSIHQKYDGLVVLTSADTTIRQSLLIGYMLQSVKIPIIFTGAPFSMKALEEGKLDTVGKKFAGFGLKSNVINAVQVATRDFERVAIMYGNRLLDPVKATRVSLSDLNIFSSTDGNYLGKVEFSIRLDEKQKLKIQTADESMIGFSSEVMVIDSARLPKFETINLGQTKILIIKVSENQRLSSVALKQLQQLPQFVLLYNYRYVLDQGSLPVISGLTDDALLTKCLWLSGVNSDKEQLLAGMKTSYLGEATIR